MVSFGRNFFFFEIVARLHSTAMSSPRVSRNVQRIFAGSLFGGDRCETGRNRGGFIDAFRLGDFARLNVRRRISRHIKHLRKRFGSITVEIAFSDLENWSFINAILREINISRGNESWLFCTEIFRYKNDNFSSNQHGSAFLGPSTTTGNPSLLLLAFPVISLALPLF